MTAKEGRVWILPSWPRRRGEQEGGGEARRVSRRGLVRLDCLAISVTGAMQVRNAVGTSNNLPKLQVQASPIIIIIIT